MRPTVLEEAPLLFPAASFWRAFALMSWAILAPRGKGLAPATEGPCRTARKLIQVVTPSVPLVPRAWVSMRVGCMLVLADVRPWKKPAPPVVIRTLLELSV